jgi:thiamine-monophosphate kinase
MPETPRRRGEFELIAAHFAPLAAGFPGAFGLRDDTASLSPPAGQDLVLTTDALVAGVHFLPDDPPDLIARKTLRVNLSDLAAKGARPLGYLLDAVFGPAIDDDWIAAFASGLAADQAEFGVSLLGGDTAATPGPTTLAITAIGTVAAGRMIRRSGAEPGDDIYVSGTIGDAALGLRVLDGRLPGLNEAAAEHLVGRYRLPQPRVALGPRLIGLASAAIDVSDGLVADLGHVAETSRCGAAIEAPRVPLSAAAAEALRGDAGLLAVMLGGGDDYEILFTAAPAAADALGRLAQELAVPLTRIGRVVVGEGVQVVDAEGRPIAVARAGWQHF